MNVLTLFFQLIIKYKISQNPVLKTAYFELKLKLRNYQYNFFESSFNQLLDEYKVIERDVDVLIGFIPFSLLKHNGIVSSCIEFEKNIKEHLLRRFVYLPECDREAHINLVQIKEVFGLLQTEVDQYLLRRREYFGKYNNEKPIAWPNYKEMVDLYSVSVKIVEFPQDVRLLQLTSMA